MATFDISQLNEGQRAVVSRLDEPLFVAAGAGSGKTFTLTARLVHALSRGSAGEGGRYLDSVEQALVITFTEAAALEIKERVRQALRTAGEDDPFLREESLRVDNAWISTIHGMCSRILRRHAIELGIDPKFGVCEGSVAEALLARALEEVMTDVQNGDEFAPLRSEYPLWSAGGFGSGSVVGMINDLRSEAAKSPHGYDDFICPQSNQTASEMASLQRCFDAIDALNLAEKQREVTIASLEALARFSSLAPGERTPERACEALAAVKVPDLRKQDQKPFKEDAKRQLAQAMVCAQYERVQAFSAQLVMLARKVDERYGQLKREHSYLDNDDLISCALEAVEGNPEVARDYAGRFRLVMIDEFQDTDQKQLRLISLLSGKDACHLTTVGDAQQSIYRFRGGDVEVFRARGRSLPESSHVKMDVNYRSDHNVLALVERTCGDAGLLEDFLKLACDGGRRDSYVAREADGAEAPRIRLEVATGGNAEIMSATLAAQLADRLARYRSQGQAPGSMALLLGTTSKVGLYLDALRSRGLPAVVTGGSSFSTTPEVGVVQALLHTLANPHDTETGLFRLLSSDMFRLDADDFCQLGTRAQEVLDAPTKRPVEQCFIDGSLELYGGAQPSLRLRAAHAVLGRAFARLGRWELADICQAVIEESGWLSRLEERGADGLPVAANVLAAVRYVRELTRDLGLGAARAADEFDRWLAASKLTPAMLVGERVDAVQVMTIHGSKGLQFPITAVAECWGNASSSGKLSVGRVDESCVVCVGPKTDAKGFSSMLKEVEVPIEAHECGSVAEWALFLRQQEATAEQAEKNRLLYVALTRAEEALVVGIPVSDGKQYLSELAMGMLGAFPELDELSAGEHVIGVNPESPIECERRVSDGSGSTRIERVPTEAADGIARVIELIRPKRGSSDPWEVRSAGTLAGFDGELPESVTLIPTLGVERDADTTDQSEDEHFALYQMEDATPVTRGWRAREGVFSYSSAHALMEEHAQAAGATRSEARAEEKAADEEPKMPPTPPRAQQDAEAEGSSYTDDADKATNLGSAFHELAQTMVETGGAHSEERLAALARTWHLSARQLNRLRSAIGRWEGCELRREALSYDLVRPEVPFFVRVDSVYGQYVEGAIDLLACDRGSREALVVDYKTGDAGLILSQIEERHRMQANFYAWVLMDQGFECVDCAFVCVELDDGSGGPIVVRYAFDQDHRPMIGE
ncbi:MAG: UvrD-helicase domain-containing protein [Atopobiaceae bacterium]|nr:UvrD-helicase domain-containing protein [Atopobiaceae bacterium]